MSVLGVDLGAFFVTVREVGRDPALVLLAARALTLRGQAAVTFQALGWVLGLSRRAVVRCLRRLSDAGAIVWHEEAGRGVIAVEVVDELPGLRPLFGPDDTPPFSSHALPTHWFVQAVPTYGRRTFVAYLYLRSRERRDGLTPPVLLAGIARACRLRSVAEARLLLWRLRRRGVVVPIGGHRYAVLDPRPPTADERRMLRLRELGLVPPTVTGRALLFGTVVVPLLAAAVALFLLLHP